METLDDHPNDALRTSGALAAVFWRAPGRPDLSAPTAGDPLLVVGNHGRWVVECPCGSAQLACQSDPRFLCADCGNAYQGGAFRPVSWPDDTTQLAELLDVRPTPLANWQPGETVDEIAAENTQIDADDQPGDDTPAEDISTDDGGEP